MDLGHGTGKGVLAGALMNHFDRVCGIEILDDLYTQSLKIKQIYNSAKWEGKKSKFDLLHGDMFDEGFNWAQDADLVLIPSTCFDVDLMRKLA